MSSSESVTHWKRLLSVSNRAAAQRLGRGCAVGAVRDQYQLVWAAWEQESPR
jgi:hypothetical protein